MRKKMRLRTELVVGGEVADVFLTEGAMAAVVLKVAKDVDGTLA
jgi:hypothetical protein